MNMDFDEAIQKFQQADELYRKGFWVDALVLLNELDACYPRMKRLMFPRALCLYRLGRLHDASILCGECIECFGYHRARALQDEIERRFLSEEGLSASASPQDEETPEASPETPAVGADIYLGAETALIMQSRPLIGPILALATLGSLIAAAAAAWWALGRFGAQ
jgi:hypothetical protein